MQAGHSLLASYCPLPALGILCDDEGRPWQDGGEGLLLCANISEWAGEAQAVCLESLIGGCGSALKNGVMHWEGLSLGSWRLGSHLGSALHFL